MMDMHIHIRKGLDDYNELQKYIDIGKKKNINIFLLLEHGERISPKHIGYLTNYQEVIKFNKAIEWCRKKNPKIKILKGIELDYSYDESFRKKMKYFLDKYNFDYVIGSIHSMKFKDDKEYFLSIIEMIKEYPITIIGHIILRENWKEYINLLKQIVELCSLHNIKIEINTSDRARWNNEQLKYMLTEMKKKNVFFTIGSDAHNCNEVGYLVNETNKKIKKIQKGMIG